MGEFLEWPFVGSEALASRLIPERAMRTLYQPVYPDVFIPWGVAPSAEERARAAWLWSGRRGVVAGCSAAAMLGAKWVDRAAPAELIHDNRKPPAGLIVHSDMLLDSEIREVSGIAVTDAARTAYDIGRHTESRVRAIQRLDALANATDVKAIDVEAVMAAHRGARGLARLRQALPLVDGGAESPQETVARLALIDAGLPCPRTQVEIFDEYGLFVARVDLAYDDVKVAIEYDGPQHWMDPAVRQRDIDKQVEMNDLGWHLTRVSRNHLRYRRPAYVHRVADVLRKRGRVW